MKKLILLSITAIVLFGCSKKTDAGAADAENGYPLDTIDLVSSKDSSLATVDAQAEMENEGETSEVVIDEAEADSAVVAVE